ncbi:unnamed protein product [Triticum aestivum]|uniref:Uncharacterized protein n=3 Tax=Triticinae TaxID=1648030 RepID=A0A9R1EQU3_WHEAT|nr:ribonuclease 1-like [Aegilops tauschii subsp. strangulata]XP_044327903.1 ribonuclease 1-like [Triticum aestivum]KAF7014646.1 hypothetical protein CFC21_028623 [Triticum aestivum]SPT16859.1 unnamed protein product [Triticum aestivum]
MRLHYCSLTVVLLPFLLASATDFDFFYHVQKWPGSFCDTTGGCCFPGNVKPAADFGIHGLWPNYAACRPAGETNRTRCWPDFCNATNTFAPSLISDLKSDMDRNWGTLSCRSNDSTAFWSHEWSRHGTCSNMDQHAYFLAALRYKARFNLTRILLDSGIVPSEERTYCVGSIRDAIGEATGSAPGIECNRNARNETQLYQVYQCVDLAGTGPIPCPAVPMQGRCTDQVKFPAF